MKKIQLAKEFSSRPGGRKHSEFWPNSGERFFKEFVLPSLKNREGIVVNLDGVNSLASSFYDEVYKLALACDEIDHDIRENLLDWLKFEISDELSERLFGFVRTILEERVGSWNPEIA